MDPDAASKPSSTPHSSGLTGSTTAACSNPSATSRLPKPKSYIMLTRTTSAWQRDSQPNASGKPGRFIPSDPFGLHRREEALHRRVVPDFARPAHRAGDATVGHHISRWNCSLVYWADSTGRRNTLTKEVAMGMKKRRSDRCGRPPLRSPGWPPVSTRSERRLFWTFIAAGMSSEAAAAKAGVSQPVGTRWFRKAGGMVPGQASRTGRR